MLTGATPAAIHRYLDSTYCNNDCVLVAYHRAPGSVTRALWPDTVIQRCYFHIHANVRTHLTRNFRIQAGKELLAWTRTLDKITTADQAAAYTAEFVSWALKWDAMLKQQTYLNGGND